MKCVKTMRRRTEKIIEAWAKGTKGQIISPIPDETCQILLFRRPRIL
jgi:hypothetical protein